MLRLLLLLSLTTLAPATGLKIVTIGDSLTDGYDEVAKIAEIPGLDLFVGDRIYPVPDNDPTNANVFNWPELLSIFRSDETDFGPEGSWYEELFGFPLPTSDLRFRGYQRNFAVVGTTTTNWKNLVQATSIIPAPGTASPINTFYWSTKQSLITEINTADVVVILLGGNDLKNDYDQIFIDPDPSDLLDPIRANLDIIHSFVRTTNTTVPIVVTTVPDVGATPNIYQTYNAPALQATTRANIAAMNQAIISTFEAKSNTAVARVDRLTDLAFDVVPFHLNGTEFTIEGDPLNPPDHLFCKDDFHPATAAQALIANEIMIAINSLIPASMTLFTHREILEDMLGFDPDQPYIDWATTYTLGPDTFDIDSDGDGLANGLEMLLGTSPILRGATYGGKWLPGNSLTWNISATAERYLDWVAEESSDLSNWNEVPEARFDLTAGAATATPPSGDRSFFRIQATPKP